MYFYIYDSFLTDKKYERELAAIENRITDLGLSGKIGRLSAFTNARGLIRDEAKRGAQTVVVVGNDETIAKVVEGIGDAKITLGIIPVGEPAEIGRALGIPVGTDACDILSRRVTQKIDLGSVNGRLFLYELRILGGNVSIESEGKYRVTALKPDCDITISNLRGPDAGLRDSDGYAAGDPMDGWLDALITPRSQGFGSMFQSREDKASSVIPLRRASITSETPIAAVADGREFTNESLSIEVVPDRLRIITGRERAFA